VADRATGATAPVARGLSRPGALRRIVFYGAFRGATELLFAARGVLLAAILGPAGFGGWELFRLARRYAAFAELGMGRGIEFEVSRREDAADIAERRRYGEAALGFVAVVFSGIGALSLAASFLVADALTAFGLAVFGAATLLERLWFYGIGYLRASGSLKRFAFIEVTNAALQVLMAVGLAQFWGLRGALVGVAAASFASVLLLGRYVPIRPRLDIARWRTMLQTGTPVAVMLLSTTILTTADRLLVAGAGGALLLGHYGFAVALSSMAIAFAWVVRTIVFPDVYRRAERGGAASALSDLLSRNVLPFAVLYPPLLGAFALLMAPAIATFLPDYVEAVDPARLLVFAGVASGFLGLGSVGVVAASRQRALPPLALAAVALNVGGSYAALRAGWGLEGVALMSLGARSAYGAAVLALNAYAAELPRVGWFVFCSLLPLGYCAGVVALIGHLYDGNDWNSQPKVLGLYTLLMLPLVPWIWSQLRRFRW
jgi:O-antigen/teichoic acid export membrane protein